MKSAWFAQIRRLTFPCKLTLAVTILLANSTITHATPLGSDDGMQIQMHETKGKKKKVPKVVARDVTPLPHFSSPFVRRSAPQFEPIEEQSAAVASSRNQIASDSPTPSRRQRSELPAMRESSRMESRMSGGDSSPAAWMAWADYSALGVLTNPESPTTATGVSLATSPSSRTLDQILALGVGVDLGSKLRLSMDTHLQFESQLDGSNSNTAGAAGTASTTTGPSVTDVFGHAMYRADLSPWLGAGETLKFDFGASAPFSPEARAEGYEAVYVGSLQLSSRLIPSLLTLQNTLSADYIWNRYQYSTLTDLAHQQGGGGYRLGLAWRLGPNFELLTSAGVKATPSFDGSVATHFNAATALAYKINSWLLHLGYSGGTYQELSGQNLWYVDRPQQVISAGVGIRF